MQSRYERLKESILMSSVKQVKKIREARQSSRDWGGSQATLGTVGHGEDWVSS